MPLGLPSSPTNGQQWPVVSPVWEYNATLGRWEALAVGGGAVLPIGDASWTLTPGIGSASLNIVTPPSGGGVEYRVDAGSPVVLPGDGSGAHTIAGLPAGVAADVEVRAVYPSAWSAPKSVTPTAPAVTLVQETDPVYFNGDGTTPSVTLTFDQASAAGNTLIVHASMGYWSTVTITDSAGGTVAGGQWTVEIDSGAFSVAGDGDPLADNIDRQYVWVRRNCPAGLTSVVVARDGNFSTRCYMREVSGLSNVAAIVRSNARNVATQSAVSVAVAGAGFFSTLVRTSPSRTPVSASAGSVVRRLDFLSDGVTPYSGPVSEHTIHGISTGARNYDSSWADGDCTVGRHGIFIPAA